MSRGAIWWGVKKHFSLDLSSDCARIYKKKHVQFLLITTSNDNSTHILLRADESCEEIFTNSPFIKNSPSLLSNFVPSFPLFEIHKIHKKAQFYEWENEFRDHDIDPLQRWAATRKYYENTCQIHYSPYRGVNLKGNTKIHNYDSVNLLKALHFTFTKLMFKKNERKRQKRKPKLRTGIFILWGIFRYKFALQLSIGVNYNQIRRISFINSNEYLTPFSFNDLFNGQPFLTKSFSLNWKALISINWWNKVKEKSHDLRLA